MQIHFGLTSIQLVQGDITQQRVDVIVNAANAALAGGAGVDGAIHRAAGPSVLQETQRRYPDGCPAGQAVVTAAGDLPVRYIFHTVGPVWQGGRQGEEALLRSCYRNCLQLAVDHGCNSIAFPAISTGAYHYPLDLASQHSLDEVRSFLTRHQAPTLVRFVLFSDGAWAAWAQTLEELMTNP